MQFRRLCRYLTAQHAGEQRTDQGVVRQPVPPAGSHRRRGIEYPLAGGIPQVALRHHQIHQADATSSAGIDAATAQHHVHGLEAADQGGQSNAAAEPGMYAEAHLRQAQPGAR